MPTIGNLLKLWSCSMFNPTILLKILESLLPGSIIDNNPIVQDEWQWSTCHKKLPYIFYDYNFPRVSNIVYGPYWKKSGKKDCSFALTFISYFIWHLELGQYKNGLPSVKNKFVLKLPPFSPHLHGKGKKGANFKTSMRFTETNPLLYCLSSNNRLFW